MSARGARRSLVIACAFVAAACGPWLPSPERADHAGEEPVIVTSAPPPPKIELVPARPGEQEDAVWIDGEWLWRGRRWEWKPGAWQVPPPGGAYAPPEIVYLADEKIGWFAGRWRARGGGGEGPAAPAPTPAPTPTPAVE